MKSLLIAIQFLTVVPVRPKTEATEADVARSAGAFPVVGLIQGLVLVGAAIVFGLVFNPDLSTALVLLVLVLTNGGFHLDGLADTFDGLAAGRDRERRLAVMRDGSTGAVGATAIVFSLGVKYLALKSIANLTPFTYYFTLAMMPVLSKWVMLVAMHRGGSARPDGLGRVFIQSMTTRRIAASTVLVAAMLTIPVAMVHGVDPVSGHMLSALALVVLYSWSLLVVRVSTGKIGGLTGDVLGAAGEIAENIFLLLVLAWSSFYTL